MLNLSTIQANLITVMKLIKTAGGYATEIPDVNIYSEFTEDIVGQTDDADYPKLFVVLDQGIVGEGLSEEDVVEVSFMVIVVDKDLNGIGETPLSQKVANVIDDVKRALRLNDDLLGSVNHIRVTEFTTDAGYSHPEGVVVLRLSASVYDRSY